MRIAFVGSRGFKDLDFVRWCVISIYRKYGKFVLISGGAKGPDTIAENQAKALGLIRNIHYADWNKYGKAAGPMRNEYIVQDSDYIIAFWDGISSGTQSTINFAKQYNKPLKLFKEYHGQE